MCEREVQIGDSGYLKGGTMANRRCWYLGRALVFIALMVLADTPGVAQTFRGTILGTVTDATGGAVPGAMVTVHNVDTGLLRKTETQGDGSYRVPELPIGTYDVTVEKPGFQTSITSGVKVDVAAERRVDAALKPGEVTETDNSFWRGASADRNNERHAWRHADARERQRFANQWARLYEADLFESRRGGLAGPNYGFAGIVRRVFNEWGARAIQQLSARRHGHERRLP